MSIRLTSTFFSLAGNEYTLRIRDKVGTGHLGYFELSSEGFEIQYDTEGQQRFSPILPSKCSFSLLIENQTQELLIAQMAAAYETQFRVEILKDGQPYWYGIILSDIAEMSDLPFPYFFSLTATDGIARLKDIPYKDEENEQPYQGRETFATILQRIIEKIGLKDLNGGKLYTLVKWKEAQHIAADVLNSTNLDQFIFYSQDTQGVYTYKSYYQVLQQIAVLWGARFFWESGGYYFQQVNDLGTQEQVLEVQKGQTLRGGIFRYFPPLRSVSLRYNYGESGNLGQGIVLSNTSQQNVYIGIVEAGKQLRLQMQIKYKTFMPALQNFNDYTIHRIRFDIKLQVGTKYLERKQEVRNFFSVFDRPMLFIDADFGRHETWGRVITEYEYNKEQTLSIDIQTPEIEESGEVYLSIEQIEIERYLVGNANTIVVNWSMSNPVIFAGDSEEEDTSNSFYRLYEAKSNILHSTKTIELETEMGDGPTSQSNNRLLVSNGTEWLTSEAWTNGTDGEPTNIGQLLVNEILTGQTTNILKMLGTIIKSNYKITQSIRYQDKYFAFLGGRLTAAIDEWTGEWFQLVRDDTEVVEQPPQTGGVSSTPESVLVQTNQSSSDQPVQDNNNHSNTILDMLSELKTNNRIPGGTAVDRIPVPDGAILYDGQYQSGDIIMLVDTVSGERQDFEVANDTILGDTEIIVKNEIANTTFNEGTFILKEVKITSPNIFKIQKHTGKTLEVPFDLPKSSVDARLVVNRGGRYLIHEFDFTIENNAEELPRLIVFTFPSFAENILIRK